MGNENGVWIMHGLSPDDENCIHTVEQLTEYINKIGFLPLFKNEIEGFSVEEHTETAYWWSGDVVRDPWEWRAVIAERGEIAYGKFFGNKAGFISKEWMPYFANCRRDGYDFDALWEDEKASYRQKKIMDVFQNGGEMISNELKEKAGFGKGGEKNFDGIVTALQMETYLCVRRFKKRKNKKGEEYGWALAVYTRPEDLWGKEITSAAYFEAPVLSRKRIKEQMKKLYPSVTDEQLAKI